jgi:hypothetical protein
VLGPPPPSARAVGAAGLGLWLFVAWAAWLDRHRAALSAERLGSAGSTAPR